MDHGFDVLIQELHEGEYPLDLLMKVNEIHLCFVNQLNEARRIDREEDAEREGYLEWVGSYKRHPLENSDNYFPWYNNYTVRSESFKRQRVTEEDNDNGIYDIDELNPPQRVYDVHWESSYERLMKHLGEFLEFKFEKLNPKWLNEMSLLKQTLSKNIHDDHVKCFKEKVNKYLHTNHIMFCDLQKEQLKGWCGRMTHEQTLEMLNMMKPKVANEHAKTQIFKIIFEKKYETLVNGQEDWLKYFSSF